MNEPGARPVMANLSNRDARASEPGVTGVRFIAALGVGVTVEFVLLALWERNGYWNFSDGVYALSAREFIHGLVPYMDFAAAQPPPVYLAGGVLLLIHDGVWSLRLGLGLLDMVTAGLVGVCVWRLSRSRLLVIVGVLAAPLLPITLHEHAQLTPETLAAPLLLAAALWCSRAESSTRGAVALALATACKLAFAVPALAIVAVAAGRRRSLGTFVAVGGLLAVVSLLLFGVGEWRGVVHAQLQVGHASIHYVVGLLGQAAWNEFPLVLGALAAVVLAFRATTEPNDRSLVRTLAAAAGGGLLLALTVFKRGSYINVLAPAEPPLLALALCGAYWLWPGARPGRAVTVALTALLAAQSVSLLTDPGDPWAAKRPGAASGLSWTEGPSAVNRTVAVAERCPAGAAYSGQPYIAFLANRRMPGEQPDPFMLEYAQADAGFAHRAARDRQRCPAA